MAKRKKKAKKEFVPHEEFIAFRDEFNKRAESFACSKIPMVAGMQNMFFVVCRLIEQYEEKFPTWEQIERGVEGMRTFGYAPKNPGWYLSHKGDEKYPNLLSCVGHGEKVESVVDESPATHRFSERE